MITDAFSRASEPIITEEACYGPQGHSADVCLITFSNVIYQQILDAFPCRELGRMRCCNGEKPIYGFTWQGLRVVFYLSGITSALAATEALDANWLTGAETFVAFGSAGCLDREKAGGRYVIPTAAYRDEGMSYHYAPPADYIDLPGAALVEKVFKELKAPYAVGRVWTTDAFFRELRHQAEVRKAEGCLAVDMEAAGIQSVCAFHGLRLYYFLMTGDVLDAPEWDNQSLSSANHCPDHLQIALKIAEAALTGAC